MNKNEKKKTKKKYYKRNRSHFGNIQYVLELLCLSQWTYKNSQFSPL